MGRVGWEPWKVSQNRTLLCSRALDIGNGTTRHPRVLARVPDPLLAPPMSHQPFRPLGGAQPKSPAQGFSRGRGLMPRRVGLLRHRPLYPPSWCCGRSTSTVLPQGAGLHALHFLGLLLPVVPAPLHQPARPLVHDLLLPVPGPGHGEQVAPLLELRLLGSYCWPL